MTKVDEACPLVAGDLKNVYRSVYLQRKVTVIPLRCLFLRRNLQFNPCLFPVFQAREMSESFGIPLSCVLLVKSYSEELELDEDVNILLLTAVEQMLNYSDSFFENQVVDHAKTDQPELYRFTDWFRPDLSEQNKLHIWKIESRFYHNELVVQIPNIKRYVWFVKRLSFDMRSITTSQDHWICSYFLLWFGLVCSYIKFSLNVYGFFACSLSTLSQKHSSYLWFKKNNHKMKTNG